MVYATFVSPFARCQSVGENRKTEKKKNVWKVRENISKPRKTFKKVQQQLREKMVEKGQKNKAI